MTWPHCYLPIHCRKPSGPLELSSKEEIIALSYFFLNKKFNLRRRSLTVAPLPSLQSRGVNLSGFSLVCTPALYCACYTLSHSLLAGVLAHRPHSIHFTDESCHREETPAVTPPGWTRASEHTAHVFSSSAPLAYPMPAAPQHEGDLGGVIDRR